ncbi:MAG: T9SS type A sorting domain-containing protein, partial [Bacteroidales bacterium]|nr:T9SS type A sorting domain-containing protein [Bacteroidales bacterium]
DTLFFEVPVDTTPCPDVHGLAASWLDTDCVYVTWTPVDDQSTYQLNYAEADSLFENGTFVSCPHPYVQVCGLSTNKAYKMRVRTPCTTGMASEGYGPWSDTLLFNPQPTGIDDVGQGGIRIRPNPARDRLTVERPTAGPATFEVFNAKGQKVLSQTSDQATVTLDVSSLVAGSYLLRVTTAEGSSVRTFVVGK